MEYQIDLIYYFKDKTQNISFFDNKRVIHIYLCRYKMYISIFIYENVDIYMDIYIYQLLYMNMEIFIYIYIYLVRYFNNLDEKNNFKNMSDNNNNLDENTYFSTLKYYSLSLLYR